jgi:hypothetical protein
MRWEIIDDPNTWNLSFLIGVIGVAEGASGAGMNTKFHLAVTTGGGVVERF